MRACVQRKTLSSLLKPSSNDQLMLSSCTHNRRTEPELRYRLLQSLRVVAYLIGCHSSRLGDNVSTWIVVDIIILGDPGAAESRGSDLFGTVRYFRTTIDIKTGRAPGSHSKRVPEEFTLSAINVQWLGVATKLQRFLGSPRF